MAENPYAPPQSRVEDAPLSLPDGEFIPGGRGVPAGNGWRWIADAWTFMGDQRWVFIGVCLLYVLVLVVVNFIPYVGPIAINFLFPILLGGLLLGFDAVRRGQPLEVGHLFLGFQARCVRRLLTIGAISLVFGLVIGVAMGVILGPETVEMLMSGAEPPTPEEALAVLLQLLLALLVALALSLPVLMAMMFGPALVVLADAAAVQALKTSFVACLKNVLPFFVWNVAALVLWIVAAIPLFLGWLLLMPVLIVSLYLAYRDVFHEI
jgi:hypothetical protein